MTHLAQIAAMADSHYSVRKEEKEGRTFTNVETLDRQGRKEELARLTGGTHLSTAILEGAEELLGKQKPSRMAVDKQEKMV